MASGRAVNSSTHTINQSRLVYLNEKEKPKVARPEIPRISKQPKGNLIFSSRYNSHVLFKVYTCFLLFLSFFKF